MKLNSKNPTILFRKLILPFLNKYVFIGFILLIAYVGSWPLWISKVDWGYGHERKHFLTNKPVKVYHYIRGYPIKWLETLEEKLSSTSTSSLGPSYAVAPAPSHWVNSESLASFAFSFYYPLELLSSNSENQSIRMYFIQNSDNIRKFNSLSEEEKRIQFNQLSEYHGKLFYLENYSSTSTLLPYQDVDKFLYKKYEVEPFRFFINSNTELKPGCCGQSGDGFDEFCYNKSTYDKMMQEALNFVSWYNHYSLTNPTIKMVESKRYRE